MEAYTSSWHRPKITLYNEKVEQIKGFTVKFDDGIIIRDLTFMEDDKQGDLTESNKEYIFRILDGVHTDWKPNMLSGVVEIEESADIGDTYNIVIKFLY